MQRILATLLITSFLTLSSLVPGGPIETRDFSHIPMLTLIMFNIFLAILGLTSLLLAYFVYQGSRTATSTAMWCGFSYIAVYGLDLLTLFPVSPSPMPDALIWLEVAGIILAIPIIGIAALSHNSKESIATNPSSQNNFHVKTWLTLLGLFAAFAFVIVVFATLAAMGK